MGPIEDEFAKALRSTVKRKPNTTLPLGAPHQLQCKARRVVSGAPEVMVKITGFGRGAEHVKAHLDYISRHGKLEVENDRGEVFTSKEELKELFNDWKLDFSTSQRRKNQRDTMHMIVSMPEGTLPGAVRNAAREFSEKTFGHNYEYLFALHTDEPHPHAHITVKTRGFNRRRLHVGKETVQEWREEFAQALQQQGVDAEATPRSSRGVVRKPEQQVIRHIERGDKTHPRRVSKVRAAKIKEIAAELSGEAQGQAVAPRPWEEKIRVAQATIRAAWLAAADQLGRSPASEDQAFARRIKSFVAAMPKVDTERHELRRMLLERFACQREEHQGTSADPSMANQRGKSVER